MIVVSRHLSIHWGQLKCRPNWGKAAFESLKKVAAGQNHIAELVVSRKVEPDHFDQILQDAKPEIEEFALTERDWNMRRKGPRTGETNIKQKHSGRIRPRSILRPSCPFAGREPY